MLGAGYQNHRIAPYPDAVQEHDVVDLAGTRGDRPQLPEPRAFAPEGAAASGHVLLRLLREEPPQKGREQLRRRIDAMGQRGAAPFATPPLAPR